jgi:hypothetical protein
LIVEQATVLEAGMSRRRMRDAASHLRGVAVRNDGRFGASPEARALDAACSKLMDWANYWAQRAQDAYNNGDQQGYQDALKMYAYNVNQYNKTCAA